MGDRRNIIVTDGDMTSPNVSLYTHWDGSQAPEVLRSALIRGRSRWDDTPYLTRIIFCEMTKDDGPAETTGFGIEAMAGLVARTEANTERDIVVNTGDQTVTVGGVTESFTEYIG